MHHYSADERFHRAQTTCLQQNHSHPRKCTSWTSQVCQRMQVQCTRPWHGGPRVYCCCLFRKQFYILYSQQIQRIDLLPACHITTASQTQHSTTLAFAHTFLLLIATSLKLTSQAHASTTIQHCWMQHLSEHQSNTHHTLHPQRPHTLPRLRESRPLRERRASRVTRYLSSSS